MAISYIWALIITVVVEVPVVWLLLRRQGWPRVLPAALVANGLTHPALHFLLPRVLSPHPLARFVIVGELSVFVVEAAILLAWVRPRPWPLAIAASAAANASSFAMGLLVLPAPG